ncbi:MAG TPA: purine-binding chemotaxis protein CheW [Clostridiales bacterium]|nr:purine-binding chemotaxis protein CheW [Clostridiales bacterium]
MDTQFVIFRIGDDIYGADIYNIYEIIFPKEPTRIPNNPDFIEGVIEYRGIMVPVLDLKKRFNLGESTFNGQSRLVVAEVGEDLVAFSVDEVMEILKVQSEEIKDAPEMTKIDKEYIEGIVKQDERLIVLLDLSKVLTVDEMDILRNMEINEEDIS